MLEASILTDAVISTIPFETSAYASLTLKKACALSYIKCVLIYRYMGKKLSVKYKMKTNTQGIIY